LHPIGVRARVKVSATTLACVGSAVQFCRPRPGGNGRVAAKATGSGAATARAPATISASSATRGRRLASLLRTVAFHLMREIG